MTNGLYNSTTWPWLTEQPRAAAVGLLEEMLFTHYKYVKFEIKIQQEKDI